MSGFIDFLKVVNGVVHGIAVVVKTVEVVQSGIEIHGLVTKKGPLTTEERARLVAEIAVATFKTLDVAASGACLLGGHTSHAPLFKSMRMTTSLPLAKALRTCSFGMPL